MAQQQPTVTESSLELKSWCPGYVLRGLGVSFWNVQLRKLVKSNLCGKKSPQASFRNALELRWRNRSGF